MKKTLNNSEHVSSPLALPFTGHSLLSLGGQMLQRYSRCTLSGLGTCQASLDCSSFPLHCSAYAHNQLEKEREITRQRHQGRSHTGTASLKWPTCVFRPTETLSMAELGEASVTGESLSGLLHNSAGFVPRKACMFGIPWCSRTSWLS